MYNKTVTKKITTESLYREAEADANRFNLKCLAILCVIIILAEILNEVGIFRAPPEVMRVSAVLSLMILTVPHAVLLIRDKLMHKENSVLEETSFKYFIIVSIYLGIGLMCVAFSFHAIILIAIPPLIAAQYRHQKGLFAWIMTVTLLLVPIGVYGSFFFGTTDRNFVKGMMTDEEFAILANRIKLATSQRMWELFLHYVLPRIFGAVAIVLLVSGITRRNKKMLKKQMELNEQVQQEMEHVTKIQRHVIDSLATLIETRDAGTGEHVIRTKRYVRMIADRLRQNEKYADRLTDDDIERIENAAPLHDVGKIVVSDTILLKPGKLTAEEFEKMKIHTVKGKSVIQDIFTGMGDEQFLQTAEQIAVAHHEKWDGSGYPEGLKGEDIPLPARIMAVADVFDALVSVRVYKNSVPPEKALDIMTDESGTHFDPDIMLTVNGMRDELIRTAMLPFEEVKK
ncbi:MAG: HD domain-containing protein [Clostridia bacterium]|nr:HD domain-containing protein [Clostridia bacterium]